MQQPWEEDFAEVGRLSGRREGGTFEMPIREEGHFEFNSGDAGGEVSAAALR